MEWVHGRVFNLLAARDMFSISGVATESAKFHLDLRECVLRESTSIFFQSFLSWYLCSCIPLFLPSEGGDGT